MLEKMMSGFMTLESDELFYINGGSTQWYVNYPGPDTEPSKGKESEDKSSGGSSGGGSTGGSSK